MRLLVLLVEFFVVIVEMAISLRPLMAHRWLFHLRKCFQPEYIISKCHPPRYVQIPNYFSLFYLNLKECSRHISALGVSSCAFLCSLEVSPRQPTRVVGATTSIIAFQLFTVALANPIRCHPRRNVERPFLSNKF